MYAVVRTGGKQYQVSTGEIVKVEQLQGQPGDTVQLEEVLMLSDGEKVTLGHPLVEGAKVIAEIVNQDKHRKVVIFKYKRRKRYRQKAGHRQPFTALRITQIQGPWGQPSTESAPAVSPTAEAE